MSRYLLGRVVAFRGENEYYDCDGAQVEITDRDGDAVEIATDVRGIRVYVKVSLAELVRQAMRKDKS